MENKTTAASMPVRIRVMGRNFLSPSAAQNFAGEAWHGGGVTAS